MPTVFAVLEAHPKMLKAWHAVGYHGETPLRQLCVVWESTLQPVNRKQLQPVEP